MHNRRESGGFPLYYYQTRDDSFPERLAARLGARRKVPVPTFRERLEWHPHDERFEILARQGYLTRERGGFGEMPPEAWEDYVEYQWSEDDTAAEKAGERAVRARDAWLDEPQVPLTQNQRRRMWMHWPPVKPPPWEEHWANPANHPVNLVPPPAPLTLDQIAPGIDPTREPFQFEDVPEEPAPRRRKRE